LTSETLKINAANLFNPNNNFKRKGKAMEGDKNWLEGKWNEVKGEIRKKWGQLTENDMEQTKGNLQSLAGLLEQKLGLAKNEVDKYLHDLGDRFSEAKTKH
jgi:uncharacterized protein YjbJ (UPF0337 family)